MPSHQAAVGRDVGKLDTDSGGLARYSLKLQVPPGIRHGTEPELSLEYCQGTPNGSLGVGWALGGISCIRRAPSNLAYDGINPPPSNYDRSQPKLTLDGAQLLNIAGEYGAQDAKYKTEVDQAGSTVMPMGSGFVIRDSTGRQAEYGTTDDSRVLVPGRQQAREWRLKRTIDYHGNAITYTYSSSPQISGPTRDENACYLSEILYTSNIKTGYVGKRIVKFDYTSRPDPIVEMAQGTKCVWASLLAAVRFGVKKDDSVRIDRSYELAYETSTASGDSCLVSVIESSGSGANRVDLLPSTFGYTQSGVSAKDTYRTASQQRVIDLRSTTNNIALFTMNTSGRCLADLLCVRYDPKSRQMSLKTYLADRLPDGRVTWAPSKGPGAEASLPPINLRDGFPSILSPDTNKDGRADFIVPYPDSDNNLRFSISQCVGTGYQNARVKATDFKWATGAKFMTLNYAEGASSIIQIFTEGSKLAFRNFPGFTDKGEIGLRDAITTRTSFENSGTIDWIPLTHPTTGANSLVRIWADDIGQGQSQIKATNFTINDTDGTFHHDAPSLLGPPIRMARTKYNVLTCDIAAHGSQDILLATAEYQANRMKMTFSVFLGDGFGAFAMHGDSIVKESPAPAPLSSELGGKFHVTNLNGSNYPSLSYVYQAKSPKAYVCLSTDGDSSGRLGDITVYELAKDLPSENMEVVPADLNGNGIGDWLLYTLDNDLPRVLPVYNHSNVVDFLSWAQDPMGLRTEVKYGCLSDPSVYESGVDWKNYSKDSADSYPVLAAPNYAVTQLTHRNDISINCFPFEVTIKKSYAKARVNTSGRGWQSFGEIKTLNASDGILTTERYLQSWPLTGSKCQVDTQDPSGKVLRSVKVSYKSSSTRQGPWSIHRTDKALEQTDMIDDGAVARTNTTRYEYDEHGNMTLLSASEMQHGQLMYQSTKRSAYTTIDGVTGVLTSQKQSAHENNINMTAFETGDSSLVVYESMPSKAVLKAASTWSSDINGFSEKQFRFDEYGREVQTIDAAGLETSTTYDTTFQTFPIKVTEDGPGVFATELTAFDEASGLEVARMEHNGLITCYHLDGFGRTIETRTKAAERGPSTVPAGDFLSSNPYVTDPGFMALLTSSDLDPSRKIAFERETSPKGAHHICVKVTAYSSEGVEGKHEVVDYLDCIKQVRKRSSHDADEVDKTWTSWEYDSRGQRVFESFPIRVPASLALDWTPDQKAGTSSTFDLLGRPLIRVRPAHGKLNKFIASATSYHDGGARVKERTMTADDIDAQSLVNALELATIERRYLHINKTDLVIENIDENQLRSTFEYDAFGRLIRSTDPAGQIEVRSYNSRGDLATFDNPYQNTTQQSGVAALEYSYDKAGQMTAERNAAGEIISYQRDAKGRVVLKKGHDGRAVKVVYDQTGPDRLLSVTVFSNGTGNPFESQCEFAYDNRGRVKDRKLTLEDGTAYMTSMSYDWQDRLLQKRLPDGTILMKKYQGSETASSSLSGSSGESDSAWALKAETLQRNAYGRPERLTISGTGLTGTFTHDWEYDSQGFPVKHGLVSASNLLVQEQYDYNDMDQISRKHELLSGNTTDYTYAGKRLSSSRSTLGASNSYSYDAAGNLTQNRGCSLKYSPGQVIGTKDATTVFDIKYDDAGRLTKRLTDRSALLLSYDSLGSLKSIEDTKNNITSNFINDFEGDMLQRKHSDGSSDLLISPEFSIHVQSDGSRTVRYNLMVASDTNEDGHVAATVHKTSSSKGIKGPQEESLNVKIQFCDTKGSVTSVFDGGDASLLKKLAYDDFGLFDQSAAPDLGDDGSATYEGNYYDRTSEIYDFGARWYDPLVGRFTTPDDVLDVSLLLRADGLNRYAFENNDPINHTDPTGHWSWSGVLGVVVSVGLIVAAVAVTVATGGAAAPLAAAAVGALASGGISGVIYSVKHKDEENAGKFWGGFATTVRLNMTIGALTGGLGAAAGGVSFASAGARILARAAAGAVLGGTASVLTKAVERGVENEFYGAHHDLFEGALKNFGTGALVGGIFGAASGLKGSASSSSPNKLLGINKFEGSFKLRSFSGIKQVLAPQPTNPWAGFTKELLKTTAVAVLKPTGKLAWRGVQENGWDKALLRSAMS